MSYVPGGSLVQLFPGGSSARQNTQGKLTAWNSGTGANTVEIGNAEFTNVPVLGTPTMTAPCTVLLLPFGSSQYVIAGPIRTP